MRNSLAYYCASIGADRLLVQGAGGNVSWKDGDTLYVKASGTWLCDAASRDIFVPVDLAHLQAALLAGNFAVTPQLRGESALRPSIETLLHALMPFPVVVHVHAIEALACLVREDCAALLRDRLGNTVVWSLAGYHKPGAPLAEAVAAALHAKPGAQVILLQNHGVVIGGADVGEIDTLLRTVTHLLATPPTHAVVAPQSVASLQVGGRTLTAVADADIQQLALNPALYARLANDWALYPDHVVFLGARATLHDSIEAMTKAGGAMTALPGPVFVRDVGVFAGEEFNAARHAQLLCYYDVIAREPAGTVLHPLDANQIAELLGWDAEQYRMHLSR